MAVVIPVISTFDSKGIDRAIRDFKKLDDGASRGAFGLLNANKASTSLVAGLGKITAIGGAVVGVIGSGLVSAAYESQKVLAQTEAIVRSTGGAANITAKQVAELSEQLSMQIGVDDELIQKSANLLLTFKAVQNQAGEGNDIFNQALQSALDLGNVFGSTDAAAKQLGKALSDPIKGVTALKKAGVDFTDQQRAQIKTLVQSGKTLEAQKIILKEVQSQVGGTAAASATGFDKMRVAVGNMSEKLGGLLLPYVEQFSNFVINNVVPVVERFSNIVGEDGLGAGLNYLSGSIISAIWNAGALGKTLMVVAGVFGIIKVATVVYTAVQTAFRIATTLSSGALKELIVSLNATKVAMLAAGGVTALITAAAAIYGAYANNKSDATNRTIDFVNALKMEGDAQVEALAALYKSDPAFKQSMDTLAKYGQTVDNLSGYISGNAGEIGSWDAAITSVLGNATAISNITTSANPGINTQAQLYQALRDKIPGLVGATTQQIDAFIKMIVTFRGMKKETTETQAVIDLFKKSLGVTTTTTDTTGKVVKSAADKFRDYSRALKDSFRANTDFNKAVKESAKAQTALDDATKKVATAQAKVDQILKGFGAGSKEAGDAQATLTEAMRSQTRAGISHRQALLDVADAQAEVDLANRRGNPRDIQVAQDALTEAQIRLGEAQDEVATTATDVTTAQTGLNEAVNGATTASQTYLDAAAELKTAQDDLVTATDNLTAAKDREKEATRGLIEKEKALLDLRKETDDYIVKRAKKGFATLTKAEATKIAKQMKKDGITINDDMWAALGIKPFAKGGIVTKPTIGLIGEAGAEAVIPLSQAGKFGGGDTYISIEVNGGDPNAVVDALRRYQRQNGAIPIRVAS